MTMLIPTILCHFRYKRITCFFIMRLKRAHNVRFHFSLIYTSKNEITFIMVLPSLHPPFFLGVWKKLHWKEDVGKLPPTRILILRFWEESFFLVNFFWISKAHFLKRYNCLTCCRCTFKKKLRVRSLEY